MKWFEKILQVFIVFLPWSTVISVYLVYGLHIPGGNFIKEGLMLILGLLFICEIINNFQKTKTCLVRFDRITWIIFAYILVMSVVTLATTGIRGLIFGGRYDFMFLLIFLLIYHASIFFQKSLAYYIKIFLISGGLMLLVSGLLKFPLSEELLLFVGYSPNASAWDFGGAPPIFHGIHGASVRRFQGLLDNPNTMGAFILIFFGMLAYFFRYKKDWHFVVGIFGLGFIAMIVYTYSRSAMLAIVVGILVAISGFFVTILKKYRRQFFGISAILAIVVASVYVMFTSRGDQIIGRADSTKGHAERMIIGMNRFLSAPLGQGMGSAGPAYRHVLRLHDSSRAEVEKSDVFYIPESWYIQQFIEGGFLGGLLFLGIMAMIFFALYSLSPILGGMFAGIGMMNFFLHTFESSVISLLLFSLVALVIGKNRQKNHLPRFFE